MAGRRPGRYSPEYRERIVELARAGAVRGRRRASSSSLNSAIQNWVRQPDLDESRRRVGRLTIRRH